MLDGTAETLTMSAIATIVTVTWSLLTHLHVHHGYWLLKPADSMRHRWRRHSRCP